MESVVPGLFFIGEVVDVTGHLGGFNFQWAWASAAAAARSLLASTAQTPSLTLFLLRGIQGVPPSSASARSVFIRHSEQREESLFDCSLPIKCTTQLPNLPTCAIFFSAQLSNATAAQEDSLNVSYHPRP